jgi:DNA-binding transcriptional LysR family regulator
MTPFSPMTLDPMLLPTFIAVADYKTTTLAAHILHISQPSVTDHIKRLEQHLNQALFTRSRHGMALNHAGKTFYPYAKKIISLVQDSANALAKPKDITGALSLVASTTISDYVLPHLLQAFHHIYPHITIELSSKNTADTVEAVQSGRYQLGLIEGYSSSLHVQTIPFIEDELLLVGSPLKKYNLSSIHDLTAYPLIQREQGSGTREVIEKTLVDLGLDISTLDTRFQLGSTEAIKHAIEQHTGIAFISRWSVSEELHRKQLTDIKVPGLDIKRWFYWAKPIGSLDTLHQTFFKVATDTIIRLQQTAREDWVI